MVGAALRGRFLQRGRSYFWIVLQQHDPGRGVTLSRPSQGSLRNAAAQRQKHRWMNKGLLLVALDVGAGAASDGAAQTRRVPSPGGTTLTTFHRSLTRESTLRMSACSVPPLIPLADRGRCPQCLRPAPTCRLRPGPTFGLRRRTLRGETQKGYESSRLRPGRTWDSLTRIRV